MDATNVNNGVSYFVIQIARCEQLKKLKPNFDVIEKISRQNDLIGFYLFVQTEKSPYQTRMFAPYYGIPEESATGMGAGCLMAHLQKRNKVETIKIFQGLAMDPPVPSAIEAEMNKDEIWVYGAFKQEAMESAK